MEMNEYEAGMLDAVLEGFAGREELDWTQLLELFDGDEELAAAITDILAGEGLVSKSGVETANGLPEKIIRLEAATSFMDKGGFTAQIKQAEPAIAEDKAAPNREVIFEIENNITQALPVQEEILPLPESPVILPAASEQATAAELKPAPEILLEQEIAHLRHEQRGFEHRLREKDMIIQTMAAHNVTLGRFRIFIWVLLGLIAVLAIGLIFRNH